MHFAIAEASGLPFESLKTHQNEHESVRFFVSGTWQFHCRMQSIANPGTPKKSTEMNPCFFDRKLLLHPVSYESEFVIAYTAKTNVDREWVDDVRAADGFCRANHAEIADYLCDCFAKFAVELIDV